MLMITTVLVGIAAISFGALYVKSLADKNRSAKKCDSLSSENISISKKQKSLEEKNERLTISISDSKKELSETKAKLKDSEASLTRIQKENKELRTNNSILAKEQSALHLDHTNLEEAHDKLTKEFNETRQSFNSLKSKYDKLNEEFYSYRIDTDAAKVISDIENRRLKANNQNMGSEIDKLVSERTALKTELDEYKKQNSVNRMHLGKMTKAAERNATMVDDLNARIRELEQQIEDRDTQLSEAEEVRREQDGHIAFLEGEASKARSLDELREELEATIANLQKANEELIKCREELSSEKSLSDFRANKIASLQEQLRIADSELEQYRVSNDTPAESSTDTGNNTENEVVPKTREEKPQDSPVASSIDRESKIDNSNHSTAAPHTSRLKSASFEDENEDVDLPPIEGIHGDVLRSILAVYDLSSSTPDEPIDSDSFFLQDPAVVADISRKLSEADQMDKDIYVCACCGTRVRISKRDYGWRESLFFSHCRNDITCDWKKEYSISTTYNVYGANDSESTLEGVVSKYRTIKNLILSSLRTDISISKGISSVEEGKILHGRHNYMTWRRAGVYARYNTKEMVFELQTKNVLLNTITNKDLFYRMNNYYVIWIFGADEEAGYDFIKKHAPQNTMFANKRNAFIMDKESMAACEERQELVLKCNYLDPDNKWHFRKDTTGSNGILITLDELHFDENTGKPYYYDANVEFFSAHPRLESKFERDFLNTERIADTLKEAHEKRREDIIHRHALLLPRSKERIYAKPIPGAKGRMLYTKGQKYGIMSESRIIMVPAQYDEIFLWSGNKYAVRKVDVWGIIYDNGSVILEVKYLSIGYLKAGRALIKGVNESFYIDSEGHRVSNEEITLQNGWIKYRNGAKWGIKDESGNTIVQCLYDELGSFRGRLVGFINNMYQKLDSQYECEYRIPIRCTCIEMSNGIAIYKTGGVRLLALQKKPDTIGNVRSDMYLANIVFSNGTLNVNELTEKNRRKRYDVVEKDSNFQMDEICIGTVSRISGKRRYYISVADGRSTYITKNILSNTQITNAEAIHVGSLLKLQKTGFDSNYDKTIWKLLDVIDS